MYNKLRKIVLLVVGATIIVYISYLIYLRPSLFDTSSRQSKPSNENSPLQNRIASIQESLSSSGDIYPTISAQLNELQQHLSTIDPATHSDRRIDQQLPLIEQQIALLQAQDSSVEANDVMAIIQQSAQNQVRDEQLRDDALLREAVQRATTTEQQKREQLQLTVNNLNTEATRLQNQLTTLEEKRQMQSEKVARAEALQKEMAEVKLILSPFTSPGHFQPNSTSNPWDFKQTVDAEPISLSALKRLGALERTMTGLERLYITGGSKNPIFNHDRPLGAFPMCIAGSLERREYVMETVKTAQRLLNTHGQALIEAGVLQP